MGVEGGRGMSGALLKGTLQPPFQAATDWANAGLSSEVVEHEVWRSEMCVDSPVQLSPRWSATIAMRRSVLSQGLWGPVQGSIEGQDTTINMLYDVDNPPKNEMLFSVWDTKDYYSKMAT